MSNSLDPDQALHNERGPNCLRRLLLRSGPDWSCSQDQIGLFLKSDLATGNHVSQYHL